MEETKSRSMGIGKIGSPDVVIARKFRWTLAGDGLDEHWNVKVKFDFVKKTLAFSAYEVFDPERGINVHEWLENSPKKFLTFTTFNGWGNPIYKYTFNDLAVVADESEFDYSSSELAERKIVLYFDNYKREVLANKPSNSISLRAKPVDGWRITNAGSQFLDVPCEFKQENKTVRLVISRSDVKSLDLPSLSNNWGQNNGIHLNHYTDGKITGARAFKNVHAYSVSTSDWQDDQCTVSLHCVQESK